MKGDISMKNTKKFFLSIIIFSLIGISSLWYFFKSEEEYQNRLNRNLERQKAVLTKIYTSKQKETFNAKYSIIFEENLSTLTISKFAQSIYVPLFLSEEELKQNLLHAAKTLKQEKHVDEVIIFAYRQDDKLHEGGYTAGRCIYTSNLTATFDIAEVYYKNKKIYPAATEAIINKDNVNLYSKKHFEPEDIITKLKKGTEIMIIEHYRNFVTTDFIDIYQVLIWPHKNKKRQYTGWIMDDNVINVIPNKNKNTK